jgi:hypothetical protein
VITPTSDTRKALNSSESSILPMRCLEGIVLKTPKK